MAPTVLHHLRQHAEQRPDAPAYGERVGEQWRITTWADYRRHVRRAGRALLSLDVPVGARVAIFGNNCPQWTISALAAMAARAVPAGIYQTCSAEQVRYILDHAEASVVMVEHEAFWKKVEAVADRLPALRHVIWMAGGDPPTSSEGGPELHGWDEFLNLGDAVPDDDLEARIDAIEGDDTATFIYTSGTTGRPKAVMLSHSNLVETGRIGQAIHDLGAGDSILSYLPLAHVAEQMMTVHMPAFAGYTVYYAEAPERLLDYLLELQPSIFFSVPRVWEKFHSGISERLRRASGWRRLLANWAMGVGVDYADALHRGVAPGLWLRCRWATADRLVLSKVRSALGLRNLRVAASGAAPIPREILDFFSGLGVRIYEVYGLS
ncbi:MAG: AMP-binding protein, partial [Acidobacteriota bacterium]